MEFLNGLLYEPSHGCRDTTGEEGSSFRALELFWRNLFQISSENHHFRPFFSNKVLKHYQRLLEGGGGRLYGIPLAKGISPAENNMVAFR